MRAALNMLRNERASAAAEMALILPLLLSLTFMMFEGAYYAWSEHKVVMGVRDGARYAGRLDFSKYTCPSGIDNASRDAIKNMTRTGQVAGGNARVSGWGNDVNDVRVTLTCTTSVGGLYEAVGSNAPTVRVVASVPYPSIIGSTLGFSTSIQLGAVAQSPVMGL